MFGKINLKFKLPIEVSFEERLKIGINRTLSSKISNILNLEFLDIHLNLYKTEMKN